MKPFRIIGIVLLFLGAALAVASVWMGTERRALARTGARAAARVVRLVERTGDGTTTYVPVFQFMDTAGAMHEVTSSSSSRPAAFRVGEQVTLLYRPSAPDDAMPDTFGGVWLLPVALAGAALMDFFTAGLFIWLAPRAVMRTGGMVWRSSGRSS